MNKYNCGLVSISFRTHSPEEIIKAVKNAGLSCVEWGSDIHAPCNDAEKLEKIVNLQKKYGIKCSSYGTYFTLGEDNVDDLINYINAAKIIGTDIIRIWCGEKSAEEYTKEEKEKFFKECHSAARIAEKHNVTLCAECHRCTYTETAEGAMELMREVVSPNFCMYWQPNQYKTVEENISYAKLCEPYCKCVHVFNWKGDIRYPLSEGKSIWSKYFEIFKNVNTFLLEFMPDDKIDSLVEEASALKDMTKEIR